MRKIKTTVKSVAAFYGALVLAGFAYVLYRSPVFEKGTGYELYAGASSSACIVSTQNPLFDKLFTPVAGESVRYAGNRYEEIKERFSAELLFCENVCGVQNYYLYSPLLKSAVTLNGFTVNLHVAVSEEQTAAGTPLIFGGF